jgi:hypothetical protein
LRHATRDEIEASVQKTVARLKRIKQGPDVEVSERDFLLVLKDHFHRIGQDEIAEEVTDMLIGWTDQSYRPAEASFPLGDTSRFVMKNNTYKSKLLPDEQKAAPEA